MRVAMGVIASGAEGSPPVPPNTFRAGFFNIYLGIGAIGGDHYNAIEEHIQRIQADIMGLSELLSSDLATVRDVLGPNNGYTAFAFGDWSQTNLQPCIMSKFPIVQSGTLQSTPPANEFVRPPVWAEIQITDGPLVLVLSCHTESWCYTGPCANEIRPSLEYHRAVEWVRMADFINGWRVANPGSPVIVLGDMNDDDQSPQTVQFNTEPTPNNGWSSFQKGDDIPFPIPYSVYPEDQATDAGLVVYYSTNLDGDRNTIWANDPNPAFTVPIKMDYVMASALTNKGHEILDSEATQSGGLTKYGNDLPVTSSRDASDHKCVFADFEV